MKNTLFIPYNMNGIALANRFLMAPMTRSRSSQSSDFSNISIAEYHDDRAIQELALLKLDNYTPRNERWLKTTEI